MLLRTQRSWKAPGEPEDRWIGGHLQGKKKFNFFSSGGGWGGEKMSLFLNVFCLRSLGRIRVEMCISGS
jgi:hypothetical protein